MSDYAAQFQRSYNSLSPVKYPPANMPSYPAGNQSADPYRQQIQQQYYSSVLQRQQLVNPTSQRRIAGDIHRQWNYPPAPGYYPTVEQSIHRRPNDPLPPVPRHLQGNNTT